MVTQPLHVKNDCLPYYHDTNNDRLLRASKILDAAIADKKVVPLFSPSKINQLK